MRLLIAGLGRIDCTEMISSAFGADFRQLLDGASSEMVLDIGLIRKCLANHEMFMVAAIEAVQRICSWSLPEKMFKDAIFLLNDHVISSLSANR